VKFAYFVMPHVGGTWTVYKTVCAGLARYGVDMRWLGVGPGAQAALENSLWAAERPAGAVAGGYTSDELTQAKALIKELESEDYDGVFVNAACNRVHSNVVRYLDTRIRRIMTVHTITVATYAGARVLRDHVHATVCVSPRIRNDLVARLGFPQDNTICISSALNLEPFDSQAPRACSGGLLRLLSLGRLIDVDKGVFWLPRIMDRLRDCPVQLTIAGDGPDRAELERRCAHLGERVRFIGCVSPNRVSAVLAAHDVFLFPSRFEGLGLSLVEAMAFGCVPVASRIKGVTDFVVADGKDGLLFDLGNVRLAARHIRRLATDRALLARLSEAARLSVADRFGLDAMARAYFDVVRLVMMAPCPIESPLPIDAWSVPPGLRPGLRTYLPSGAKKWLRVWRERFA
jgi:glycosyltransferase involved in cell wall biosynthesis